MRESLGDWNVLCLDWRGDFTGVYIYGNSLTCTLKTCTFHCVYSLFLATNGQSAFALTSTCPWAGPETVSATHSGPNTASAASSSSHLWRLNHFFPFFRYCCQNNLGLALSFFKAFFFFIILHFNILKSSLIMLVPCIYMFLKAQRREKDPLFRENDHQYFSLSS